MEWNGTQQPKYDRDKNASRGDPETRASARTPPIVKPEIAASAVSNSVRPRTSRTGGAKRGFLPREIYHS
jgi:hypothetical protein